MSHNTTKTGNSSSQNSKNFEINLSSYSEYTKFVNKQLEKRRNSEGVREKLINDKENFLSVFMLNFDKAHVILKSLYSLSSRGQAPHDPQILLRSLLLMSTLGETSITNWVGKLQSNPLYSVFCGTTINKAPGVGTHYDFLERLENGPYQPKCKDRILPSEQRRSVSRIALCQAVLKKLKPEASDEDKDLIKKYANKTIEEENQPIVNDLEKLLNEILFLVAVEPSHEKMIIEDLSSLTLAGDGSTVASGANVNGKAICDCHKNGIYKCDHERKFSDMDAKWGWNNRIKDFVFGYRYFQLVSADNRHDLPIYLNIDSANTHEAYMLITAIDRFEKQISNLESNAKINEIALDALFDVYGVYNYLNHKEILYAIPYAKPPGKCISLGDDNQLFTDKGVPICEGGLPMNHAQIDRQGRHVFNCPVKRQARRDGKFVRVTYADECPRGKLCEPDSKMGPIVHVSETIDLRIHPKLPRDSKRYKELSNMRTTCERSNSAKKCAYHFKNVNTRVMPYAFIRLAMISILEHSRVWAKEKIEKYKDKDIFELFE